MSFILDALKKSESERQQQGPAEFAAMPSAGRSDSTPRWPWVVGLLLAVNLAVLIGLLQRPDAEPDDSEQPDPLPQPVLNEEPADFASQVAAAQRNAPREQPEPAEPPPAESNTVRPTVISRSPVDTRQVFPTFQEVVAKGAMSLPELHLDIHVYSEVPQDRFVFINMAKHREGSRLEEGPAVAEIRPDGVILEHRGVSFLLPRE